MGKIKKYISILMIVVMVLTLFPMRVSAAQVKLSKTKVTLSVGESVKLKVTGTKKKVKWSSSNKKVATVSKAGKVTGKKTGKATITAKVNGKKLKCTIKVQKASTSAKKPDTSPNADPTATPSKTPDKSSDDKSDSDSVKPHDHNYVEVAGSAKAPTCTEDGKNADQKCTICGAVITGSKINALGHDYKDTVVAATKEGKGYTHTECSRCGDSSDSNYVDYNPTAQQVYNDIIAQKTNWPEGMSWTNDNYYDWPNGIYYRGYGCAGFAFAMSDAAFGYLKARMHYDFDNVKVGDILRINNDTHYVVVLEIKSDSYIVTEGNYNKSIHWGREITKDYVKSTGTHVITRYPE